MALDFLQLGTLRLAAPYKDVVFILRTDIFEPGKIRQFIFGWRNLGHRIHRAGKLVGPNLVQLACRSQIHTHGIGLQIIETHQRTVLVVGHVIHGLHITDGFRHLHLALVEIRLHLAGGNLVEVLLVGHLFDGKRLTQHMGKADGGISHIHPDFLTQQLAVGIPGDRILIHRHARVLGIEYQGIAHCLDVVAEGTHMRIGMHLAVNGIGIDVESVDAHRIRMHPQGIFLRIVDNYRILGCESLTGFLVISEIVASERILVLLIHIHHIAIARALTILHIVKTVTSNGLVLIHQRRSAKELCLVGPGIVITVVGVHHAGTRDNPRWSHQMGSRCRYVIIQGISGNHILAAAQLYVEYKLCLSGLGVILSPVGNQLVLAVNQRTTVKEVSHIIQTVEIQTVGKQLLSAMAQHHIFAGMHHLHHSVVIGSFAGKREGVSLAVMHMTECLHRVGTLIEIGTVAGEVTALMHEGNLALHNLGIRIVAIHVVAQLIGMEQIDSVSLRALLVLPLRCLHS